MLYLSLIDSANICPLFYIVTEIDIQCFTYQYYQVIEIDIQYFAYRYYQGMSLIHDGNDGIYILLISQNIWWWFV